MLGKIALTIRNLIEYDAYVTLLVAGKAQIHSHLKTTATPRYVKALSECRHCAV
jgi:hypothetical protein